MAPHISLRTWSRPKETRVPSVSFSRRRPCGSTAAIRRLVPPRSTPMEKEDIMTIVEAPAGARRRRGDESQIKPLGRQLSLAMRAVMAAAAGDYHPLYRVVANQAGLALA